MDRINAEFQAEGTAAQLLATTARHCTLLVEPTADLQSAVLRVPPGTYLIFLITNRDMYYIGSSVPPSSGGERRWSLRDAPNGVLQNTSGSEIDSLFLFLRAIFRGNWGGSKRARYTCC